MSVEQQLALPSTRHRLDNGLRVVLHQDHSLPLIAINIWYHVGSSFECPGRTGIAHLFEHMLFQGSENVGANEHFRYVQQVGGVANGSTWFDQTNYYETLPAHCLELGLWLEADRMGFLLPGLDQEKLENQREVVMNERRQRVDNQPYGRAFERLHELMYPQDHPYSWPVIGYMQDIAAATLDDVRNFFQTHYGPQNAVLTLAGSFDSAEALRSIDRYFGEIPPGPVNSLPLVAPPDVVSSSEELLTDNVPLQRMYLGFRGPAYGSSSWFAGDFLTTILTGGKSSALYQDLVHQRQLAQDVAAMVLPMELESTVVVIATAKPEVSREQLEEAIWQHLENTVGTHRSADEIDRARNQLVTSYFSALQSVERRADLLSQYVTLFDDAAFLTTEIEHYESMRAEQLSEFASQHLTRDRATTLWVGPAEVSQATK